MTEKQIKISKRIDKMKYEIIKSIDKICTEEKFEITYAEINSAIIKVLESNNNYELKQLYKTN